MNSIAKKKYGWLYKLGISALVVIIFLGIGSAIFHKRLIRLYRVIHLFDQDVIVENFRHMDGIFGTRIVHKSDRSTKFEYDHQ